MLASIATLFPPTGEGFHPLLDFVCVAKTSYAWEQSDIAPKFCKETVDSDHCFADLG
jgi:hypothetical protein